MSELLEELYAPPEIVAAYEAGKEYERRSHKCPVTVRYIKPKVVAVERRYNSSRRKKYGVISNGQLLNPTFDTEVEAGVFLADLIPARESARAKVKIDAQVVKLY
jgi:hypothetical protein